MSAISLPLKIALVGCGQIADAHLSQLRRIRNVQTVAVCDTYEDLAWQAARRFSVPSTYTDMDKMLQAERPDVVHITTPAQTHAPLTMKLLTAGCHVYVEKPFTLDGAEAEQVIRVAEQSGRMLCVGHDQLFDPAWLRCKHLISSNAIGAVAHVESVLGYPFTGSFGQQVTSDSNHWVRKLPGGLFQNTISHPLYRITDYLHDERPTIIGGWHCHSTRSFPTEMHVTLAGQSVTGSLTFSTLIPAQRVTRVYGETGTIEVDLDAQTVRLSRRMRLPGAFAKLEAPSQHLCDAFNNACRNFWRFAVADIHYFAGMKGLFEAFYNSIRHGLHPPLAYTEVQRVTDLMDQIFGHCRQQAQGGVVPDANSRQEFATCR